MTNNRPEGTEIYLFSSLAAYGLHRLMMMQANVRGSKVLGIYSGVQSGDYLKIQSDASEYGVRVVFLENEVQKTPQPRFWEHCPKPYTLTFLRVLSLLAFRNPIRSFSIRRSFAQRKHAARKMLSNECASVLVCSEDGVSGDLATLTVAKELEVPIVDVPYGNATEYDFDVALRQRIKAGQDVVPSGREFWLIKWFAKKWLKTNTFPNALLLAPEHVMALESLGITLENPWIVHGGQSNIICVENDIAYRQYRKEGIQEYKLIRTGTPYCDVIARVRRDHSTFQGHGQIKLLVSWPPSYHDTFPGINEFDSYLDMTRQVFKFLNALPRTSLTVSLHPACSSEVRDLLLDLDIKISDDSILDLIAKHDIFSTYFSSTIRWALACGMPVVNYDAYQLEIDTYNSAPGFLSSDSFSVYCKLLEEITQNDKIYSELSNAQLEEAEAWGVLDGNSTARVFAEIDRLKSGL